MIQMVLDRAKKATSWGGGGEDLDGWSPYLTSWRAWRPSLPCQGGWWPAGVEGDIITVLPAMRHRLYFLLLLLQNYFENHCFTQSQCNPSKYHEWHTYPHLRNTHFRAGVHKMCFFLCWQRLFSIQTVAAKAPSSFRFWWVSFCLSGIFNHDRWKIEIGGICYCDVHNEGMRKH